METAADVREQFCRPISKLGVINSPLLMARLHTHYENLKVARNAPTEVVRAAYRVLAQKYHPDVNQSADAARVMQLLNEAWAVLSDPKRRAEHDAQIANDESQAETRPPGPSQRRPEQTYTYTYTKTPPSWEKRSPESPPSSHPWKARDKTNDPVHRGMGASAPSRKAAATGPLIRLNDWLGTDRGKTYAGGTVATIVVLALFGPSISEGIKRSITLPRPTYQASERNADASKTLSDQPSLLSTTRPPAKEEFAKPVPAQAQPTPSNSIPAAPLWSPNGKPWPATAGYLKGMPFRAGGGLSKLSIDNTNGGSNVYVKLCTFGLQKCNSLRHVFIPQGSSFTLGGIAPGTYDIRYRNLSSGALSKSESMPLRQIEEEQGTRYSVVRVTLYTVQDGNTHFTPLPEDQF